MWKDMCPGCRNFGIRLDRGTAGDVRTYVFSCDECGATFDGEWWYLWMEVTKQEMVRGKAYPV